MVKTLFSSTKDLLITFVTGPGGTTPGTAEARMSISGVDILPEVEFGVDATLFTVDVGG